MSKKNPKEGSYDFETRLFVLQYLVLALFVVIGIRFYILQVARHDDFQARAENNRIREIPIPAPRGNIYDRNGKLLADSTPACNIVIYPLDMTDREETTRALVENLGVDRDQLVAELNDSKRPKSQPVLVKQNASAGDRAWVAAHEYENPEIQIEFQPQRIYPNLKLAAHVLGYIGEVSSKQLENPKFADYKSGDIIGKGGIEAIYDKILRGKEGMRRLIVDSRGRPIRELQKVEPIKGQDIYTTLDLDVQKVAELEFDKTGDTGAAVAMNPQNGEILAMVSRPAFDPNVFAANVISSDNRAELRAIMSDKTNPLYNKAVQGIYPTGSTWKLLMTTAALEEGVITAKDSRLTCGGGISMGNRFVRCMGNHGSPDIHTAIVKSCDGYYYRLALKMGIDMIHDWMVRFGTGQKIGIDLPSESPGWIPDKKLKARFNPRDPEWKDFDTVLASIGQGSVAISPMQLLYATNGIMVGGEYYTPHLFKEAKATPLAPVKYYEGHPRELKLSQATIDIVAYGAWGVVNEGGTAGGVGFPRELNVGGKTGTAQVIAMEKARGGKEHRDHAWFISYAPLHTQEKPELAVVVLTENGGFGGRASAPKAKMIHAAYFSKKLGRPVLPELVARAEPVRSQAHANGVNKTPLPGGTPVVVHR
ncbi:MAG TPA: penicillin-binding protein 2 [Blastocatellia bacterium]|jgi:penicillin-binding protein 2|nr:penicillin-binding protein 2 [Blastocatellia bacterium]